MDDNQFFKQGTLLICSSLEIETALGRCREFIARTIPADEIYLNIYEPHLQGLRYVARADAAGGEKMERIIPLPPDLTVDIESGRRLTDYMLINRPQDDPVGRIIAGKLDRRDHSFIALRLHIEGRRLGVIDLFAKGWDRFSEQHARRLALLRDPFAIAMANALKHQEVVQLKERLIADNQDLQAELSARFGHEVVGADRGLRGVMAKVNQVAHLKNTILLEGETGVGKEVIDNAIHRCSPRNPESFVKVNCGAIPENLIDSELFGHEKGAFTGAVRTKRGRFERAHKGTLFLDEIGELPPWAQIRLLRVLQTQEIERVGGSLPIRLDLRVIAATHRDLARMVREGTFREDLLFRINAFPIRIPPLRERREDIPALIRHFIEKKSVELGITRIPAIAAEALADLDRHHWPGNVRELENAVERALIQHRHGPLLFQPMGANPRDQEFTLALDSRRQIQPLDTVMGDYIREALKITGGRISGPKGAATCLGLHPNTLRNRMLKLGIAFGRKYARQNEFQQDP